MNKRLLKLLSAFRISNPEHVIAILGEDVVKTKILEMLATRSEPDDVCVFIEYYNLRDNGVRSYSEIGANFTPPLTRLMIRNKIRDVFLWMRFDSFFTLFLPAYEEACGKIDRPEVSILQDKIRRLSSDLESLQNDHRDLIYQRRCCILLPPDRLIDELGMSVRTTNVLKAGGISYISELILKTKGELLAISGFGQKALYDVYEVLGAQGLSLTDRRHKL